MSQNYDLSDDGEFISYSMRIGAASYADSSCTFSTNVSV